MPHPRTVLSRFRVSSVRFPDAVTLLTVYLVLLYAVPSNRAIANLGAAGSPAVLWAIAMALVWLLAWVHRGSAGPPKSTPVRFAYALFFVAASVSYVAAVTRAIPFSEVSLADTGMIRVVAWGGIVFIANDGISDLDRLLTLVRRIVTAGALVAALGIVQFVTRQSWLDLIPTPGLRTGEGYAAVEMRGGLVRSAGTATHPLEFAMVLAMILPFAITLALRERNRAVLWRWLPVVVIVLGLALSGSRSAFVGMLAGLIVLFPTWSARVRWWLALAGVALVAVVYLASPRIITNMRYMFLAVFDDPSANSRSDSFDLLWEVYDFSPVVGRGLGTFLPTYRILDNQYFLLLLEVGLIGLALLLAVGIAAAACALLGANRSAHTAEGDLGFALAGSVAAGLALLSLFDALSFPQSAGTMFLTIGLCGAYWRLNRTATQRPEQPADLAVRGTGTG
jgi:hypothetical protein